jgi:hypothetical protein
MLFKQANNAKAEEIRQYISVNSSITFDSIKPYIESAENKYIKKILGAEQYAELLAYYHNPDAWSEYPLDPKTSAENLQLLLVLIQKALINLAFLDGFPVLSINIGDSGAFRIESDAQKPLFQYQEENLKNSFRNEGFNTLDAVLEFLESRIPEFPVFESSQTYTIFRQKFIRTASDFDMIYNISSSRLVFLHLQRYIDIVNDFEIIPVIGRSQFDELLLLVSAAGEPTGEQARLINFIKSIQAFLSVSGGIATLGVNITYNGAYFHSDTSNSSNFKKKEPAGRDTLSAIQSNTERVGKAYIQYMKDFLHANIDHFPLYADFTAYHQGVPLTPRDNTNKKTFWL